MYIKYLVGIDEVGRGPLAGPVAVGIILINKKDYLRKEVRNLLRISNDSKKISEKKRKEIFKEAKKLNKKGFLKYTINYENAEYIDKNGINRAISSCIKKGLIKLNVSPKKSQIFLDGGLRAEKKYFFQKTIIRGDQKNKIISLASIVAKVSRDEFMIKISKKYPRYGFHLHKGYGTISHMKALKKYNPSPIHRLSFLSDYKHKMK